MRMLVLGSGLQGSACAFDLLRQPGVDEVTIADLHPDDLPPFLNQYRGDRLRTVTLDARDEDAIRRLMRGHAAAMNALPYYFNLPVTEAAIDVGVHVCDLGGNTEIVFQQKALDNRAREQRVTVVPDCGLAPGMVNILAAEGLSRFSSPESVKIYVGGLPQNPEPPLNYQIVYSLEGALDYYTTPSWVLRNGTPTQVDALSEVEELDFPPPLGRLEAFHTGGGISTLPWAYENRVAVMEYKTLRYPGHAALMRAIRELGLLDDQAVAVGEQHVIPRDVFIAVVSPHLSRPAGHDIVALRVAVTGKGGPPSGTASWDLVDRYDTEHGVSAMMRTTGYSLAITGLFLARGHLGDGGVRTADEAMPYEPYIDELGKRGVVVRENT